MKVDQIYKGASNGQSKLPAFMFYVGDHMKDAGVRSSSLQARGLWWEMLCFSHEGNPRGYLTNATGKAISLEQLSRLVGESPEVVKTLLQELEDNGVFSRTAEGVIYCRRMVRDESKRAKCSEAGKRGGNPTLIGGVKGETKGRGNGDVNRKPTPSSSVSISDSEDLKTVTHTREAAGKSICPNGPSPAFQQFKTIYPRWRGEVAAWAAWQAEVLRLVSERGITDVEAEQLLLNAAIRFRDSPSGMPPPTPHDEDFRLGPERWLKEGHHVDSDAELAKPNRRSDRTRGGARRTPTKPAASANDDGESLADIFDRCNAATERLEAGTAGAIPSAQAAG